MSLIDLKALNLVELQTDAFRMQLGDKFDVDLSDCPTTITVRRYCERTDGNIHTDHRSKAITVLVYFNEQWNSDGGCLRMLRSSSDLEDYSAEVTPLGGRLLAFRRTAWSWHGHKPFVGERRMLQYNFLSNSKLEQLQPANQQDGHTFQQTCAGQSLAAGNHSNSLGVNS
jgi:SM-20-related protein